MAGFTRWTAGCALLALAAGSAPAQQAKDGPDAEAFRNPPAEARPHTLYFWMNGNVTAEGIDADFAAIKDAGMGGVLMFDGSSDVPKGPIDYLSPQWLGLIGHMAEKADTLGLKVGLHNAPGWSSSGGPWIAPERSMQQLVWTETTVAGGKPLTVKLAKPYAKLDYYRDAKLIAFPASNGDDAAYIGAVSAMQAAGPVPADTLTDRDLHSSVAVSKEAPLVVSMRQPFTAQAITLYAEKEVPPFSATLEASDDGQTWRRIGKVAVGVERGIESPGVLNFDAVTARYFRVTPPTTVKLAEAILHATPRIDQWGLKAEHSFELLPAKPPVRTESWARYGIAPAGVVDISDKLSADGVLRWTPPAGRWTIMRFGQTTTGKLNVAASDSGRGLEVDKLSTSAVDFQFDSTVGRVAKAAGVHAGKAFDMVEIDSFEAGMQNWTAELPAAFEKRNGYAITPWLPALTGRIVGDREASDRFLFDFRRTLADLMADNYYGRMQHRANQAGLKLHVEGYGPGAFDALQVSGRAQVPMTEFWTRTPWTDNRTVKMVASAAHVYGKNIVAAEAFTGEAQTSRWLDYPYALKTLGDQMFAQGFNQIFFHRYAHQPNTQAVPGMTMGPWGFNIDRTNTWFAQSRPWMEYLSRAQYMLRQGVNVSDVLYFVGEDSPNPSEAIRPQVSPDANPKIGLIFDPQVPAGYSFDHVNAEVLLKYARVVGGRIRLPNGAEYRLLVIPEGVKGMTPELAARVRSLVDQGMAVLGDKPGKALTRAGSTDEAQWRVDIDALWSGGTEKDRSVGKGRVFAGLSVGDALGALGVTPDVRCRTATPDGQVDWLHRTLEGGDIYFIANRQRRAETVTCRFRTPNAAPSLWDAETGTITRPMLYNGDNEGTDVRFQLSPAGSTFVKLDRQPDVPDGVTWIARDGTRFADLAAVTPAVKAPADSFTISLWAKPDIDLRLMPVEATKGRINETGKNYLVEARSGRDIYGDGTAVAGLALGRNGAFVIERVSPDEAPAVLVSDTPISGWTHVALVYDRGTPKLYLDGKLVRTGKKSGRTVHAGGEDAPAALGVTYFFEGNATPQRTVARALSASEVAAEAASGPPAPQAAAVPAELSRDADGGVKALVWESGRYTTSGKQGFTAKVPAPLTIKGGWDVTFQPGRGAPASIRLNRLVSLSRHADAGVRHFSGTATYSRTIDVPRSLIRKGRRIYLDLGRVEVLSSVKVNGQDLGVVWKEPYRVDITDVVKPGANQVSLAVTNLWANRMIADAALPEEGKYVEGDWAIGEDWSADDNRRTPVMARKIAELPDWYKAGEAKPEGGRVTFSTWNFYRANEPLLDSGLLGPVRLVFADEMAVK
ncbi:hypothetical protein FHS96_003505 [Sphingomonas zeicaulis]|uniref:glycosyl hydrolase n=1 Tax=Sphingomonas zeicaulis TaxID=1632740 RepID=UPI003D1ACF10